MKKILLLDDNQDILEIVEDILKYEGFEVKASTQSSGFVLNAEQYRPDLIILDYRLADGNGGELCRTLKAHPELQSIPVILFSAYVSQHVDLLSFGCDAVILKPFDLEELVLTVKRLTGSEQPSGWLA